MTETDKKPITREERLADLKANLALYATYCGHAPATNIAEALGPTGDPAYAGFTPALWASFGYVRPFRGDDTGFAAAQALAEYVCTRREPVSDHQLYNKAAELGIHAGADFPAQPFYVRTAYGTFAQVVHRLKSYLLEEIARIETELANEAAAAQPVKLIEPAHGEREHHPPTDKVKKPAKNKRSAAK